MIFCEQCQYFTHIGCLEEPLHELPEGDWYCPDCYNDPDEIVRKGERVKYSKTRAKMPSRQQKVKRDWGKGMATAGRTKTCTKVSKHHFGPIPGIDVGVSWQFRIQASEAGVHLPPVAGIAAQSDKGCQSLVLAGGYEDDEDNGEEFYYTGSGGRDLSGNKRKADQSSDQQLTKSNKGIALSCNAPFDDKNGADAGKRWKGGKAVRVLRSYQLKKHSEFAPDIGIRYDGIYKCVKYWPHNGKSGFIVWRFLFKRDDESLAPWEKRARKFSCIMKDEQDKEDRIGKKRKANGNVEQIFKKPKVDEETYDIDPEILELIRADKLNEKDWQPLIELKTRKDKWFDKVEKVGVKKFDNCLLTFFFLISLDL